MLSNKVMCRVGGQGLAAGFQKNCSQQVNSYTAGDQPRQAHLMVVKSSCVTSVPPLFAGDVGSPADRAALAVSAVRSSAFRFAADTCFTSRRTCRGDALTSFMGAQRLQRCWKCTSCGMLPTIYSPG